jgi:hypothetical protein
VTYVGDAGDKIFGEPCQDLENLKERDETEFRRRIKQPYYSEYRVKLKAYSEVYNGESRIKFMIQNIFPLSNGNHYTYEVDNLLKMLEF